MLLVTDEDFRTLREEVANAGGFLCLDGSIEWFAYYGLEFKKLYRGGIPAEELAKLNSHYGNRLVEIAKQRVNRGQE